MLPPDEIELASQPNISFEGKEKKIKKSQTLRGNQLEDFSGHNERDYEFAHAVNGFFTINEAQAATQ